jgi:hypothetical protein
MLYGVSAPFATPWSHMHPRHAVPAECHRVTLCNIVSERLGAGCPVLSVKTERVASMIYPQWTS